MWLESWNKYEQQQVNIEQKEASLEKKLDFLSNVTWEKKDYKNFIKFLETIQDTQKKEQLINFLEKSKNNKEQYEQIVDNISTFWFPWVEQAIDDFLKEFWIKVEETEQKVEDKNKEFLLVKQRFERFLSENNNREKLSELSLGREFIRQIEKGDFLSAEEFLEQHWQDLFKQIANSPNLTLEERKQLFETTKSFVVSNFPEVKVHNFDFYIWKWDNKEPNPVKILEDVEGNLSDNMVSVDLDHIPPKYDLRRIDSDYKFTNKLNSDEVSEFTSEYLDEIKSIQDLTKNLWKLGKGYSQFKKEIWSLWKENIKEIQKWNFSDFKEWLQAYLNKFRVQNSQNLERIYDDLGIPDNLKITSEDINELWRIENPNELQQKFQNFEEKYKKLQQYINSLPQKAYEKYKNKLEQQVLQDTKENKEKQQKILEFLHQTGFDLIPQQITDQLINEYRHNVYDIPGLDLNPERLDLANWMFWEEPTEEGGTKWKQNLVKFLNKLIYWEINPKSSPLNPDAFISPMGAAINPTELQAIFEQQWIKSGSMWNINKMRDNLKKEIKK